MIMIFPILLLRKFTSASNLLVLFEYTSEIPPYK